MAPCKKVVDEVYFHLSAAGAHPPGMQRRIALALRVIGEETRPSPNVVKINHRSSRVSLLAYPDFDHSPFPALSASWTFSGGEHSAPIYRSYVDTLNPPILHRKELLVGPEYPGREDWCKTTSVAEGLGLFDDSSAIGFRLNWERLIESKGYRLVGSEFLPLGNDESEQAAITESFTGVQRHLTALSRNHLSAPVQLLIRHGLLSPDKSFFDYGCGRGGDLQHLKEAGFSAEGWDPHFTPDGALRESDVVNLGFVINVIEDPAERVEALAKAYSLARQVLSVGVMLPSGRTPGRRFKDGYLTSRHTFQKYYSQLEIKDFVEQVLHREAFMVGPGVALVFADRDLEQRHCAGRHRNQNLAHRLLTAQRFARPVRERTARPRVARPSAARRRLERAKPQLDLLWKATLELGRYPAREEVEDLASLEDATGSLAAAVRMLSRHYDGELLARAAKVRADDLRLFLAACQFAKRKPYSHLEPRLQLDIKAFFGTYRAAQECGLRLLLDSSDPHQLHAACVEAAQSGLGRMLDDARGLQFHLSALERLPVILRAYVTCGLILWDALGDVDLIKIHIASGKLTLLEFDGFDEERLPLLKRRIKINLRELDYQIFEYGSPAYPQTVLCGKSRYLHEDYPDYAGQFAFDEALDATGLVPSLDAGPSLSELEHGLKLQRLEVRDGRLVPSQSTPEPDLPCGRYLTYRSFIECGETQAATGLPNLPVKPETFNALHDLARFVLDPVIDYFGAIRLTYGFCSAELGRRIRGGIAPNLDQHAALETNRLGKQICARGGAACDFIIEDEDMEEVADWIQTNTPFDRLYFYGKDRPLHVSYASEPAGLAFRMIRSNRGRRMPRPYGSSPPDES